MEMKHSSLVFTPQLTIPERTLSGFFQQLQYSPVDTFDAVLTIVLERSKLPQGSLTSPPECMLVLSAFELSRVCNEVCFRPKAIRLTLRKSNITRFKEQIFCVVSPGELTHRYYQKTKKQSDQKIKLHPQVFQHFNQPNGESRVESQMAQSIPMKLNTTH